MEDPRELVRYKPFILNRKGDGAWTMGSHRPAPWHVVVAFAKAILAANEAWLDSQTPTLEELRERYPNRRFGIRENIPCGPTFCNEAWLDDAKGNPHYSSTAYALKWLATELAKGDE